MFDRPSVQRCIHAYRKYVKRSSLPSYTSRHLANNSNPRSSPQHPPTHTGTHSRWSGSLCSARPQPASLAVGRCQLALAPAPCVCERVCVLSHCTALCVYVFVVSGCVSGCVCVCLPVYNCCALNWPICVLVGIGTPRACERV